MKVHCYDFCISLLPPVLQWTEFLKMRLCLIHLCTHLNSTPHPHNAYYIPSFIEAALKYRWKCHDVLEERINAGEGKRSVKSQRFHSKEVVMILKMPLLWEEVVIRYFRQWFHWKRQTIFFPSTSFYFLQPHSWPGNARHLRAPATGLGHLSDRPHCLHGGLHTLQCDFGASAVKLYPASG